MARRSASGRVGRFCVRVGGRWPGVVRGGALEPVAGALLRERVGAAATRLQPPTHAAAATERLCLGASSVTRYRAVEGCVQRAARASSAMRTGAVLQPLAAAHSESGALAPALHERRVGAAQTPCAGGLHVLGSSYASALGPLVILVLILFAKAQTTVCTMTISAVRVALCSARVHERPVFAAAVRDRALPAVVRGPRAEPRKRFQVGARAPNGERQVLGARRAAPRRRPQPNLSLLVLLLLRLARVF